MTQAPPCTAHLRCAAAKRSEPPSLLPSSLADAPVAPPRSRRVGQGEAYERKSKFVRCVRAAGGGCPTPVSPLARHWETYLAPPTMEAPTIRRFYSPYEGREPVGFASGPGCAASAPTLGAVGRALHDVRKKGVRHGVPFQRTPRAQKDRARRRHRSNPHLRVVPSGMPRGRLRHPPVREGRRTGEGGRRPRPPADAGAPVPAVPGPQGGGVPSRPHPLPPEARPQGPRPGQV